MGQKTTVQYRDGPYFWAYDVPMGVFLRFLILRARKVDPVPNWLEHEIGIWEMVIDVNEYGLNFDPNSTWTSSRHEQILQLVQATCGEIGEHESFSADEMCSWEHPVDPRSHEYLPSKPVLDFGIAVRELLQESLPTPPKGTLWFLSSKGREAVEVRHP